MNEKIEKNKLYKFFIILLSIVLIIIIFSQKENQKRFLNFFNRDDISNINISKKKTINLENIKDAINYKDVVVIHKDNKLIGYNYDGKVIWEKDIVLKDYNLYFGDMNIYIYDKPTGYIQFVNSSGNIFNEEYLDEEIIGLRKDNGKVLVHTRDEDTEKLYIINDEAEIVETNDLDLKNILTYTASKDYTSYGMSILNPERMKDSRFIAFKYDGLVLYRKEFKEEMVLYSQFLDTHRVVIMTDKNIYLLNDFEGNTLWQKSYELIKDIDVNENKINILYGNTLETISVAGNIDSKYSFIEDYNNVVSFDNFIIVYGEKDIMAIKDGKELFKEEVNSELVKIQPGKDKFIIIYKDKVDIYNIVN